MNAMVGYGLGLSWARCDLGLLWAGYNLGLAC